MTDKTMVSVPRDIAQRLADFCYLIGIPVDSPVIRDLREKLAAPAEDVRAVVDEPVAWMQFDGKGNNDFTDDLDTAERWAKNNGPKYADWLVPLFPRPQRPVVLPERKPQRITDPYALGWNAYADEYARINK